VDHWKYITHWSAYEGKGHSDGSIIDVITDPVGIIKEIYHTITVCHHHHGNIHDR
jgi:hypothetical protein